MWKPRTRSRAGEPPDDGTEVFVLGKPGIYEAKGEFQFNVTRIIPTAAIGAAQRELERVQASCSSGTACSIRRGSGRFRSCACTVAVVTSTAGAALRDVITVIGKRWPCCRLLVVNARVQGDGAVRALVRALRLVNRIPDVELCIVGRGGGGREDLAAFNSEAVCRALAAVRVPTISAVGHETDISLTDLVADIRAADAVRGGGDGRRRPARGARASSTTSPRGSPAGSATAPGWPPSGWPAPATGFSGAVEARAPARAPPGGPARRPARRAEPAPHPRPRLRGAGRRPTATFSSAGRSSAPARPSDCGWPTATSAARVESS